MGPSIRRSTSLVLLALLGAGCSGLSAKGTVKGTVTLDGLPLKEGFVRFVPVDGKTQTETAPITDGKFTATVPLGEMQVEFSAPKVIRQRKVYDTPDSPLVDDVGELIPERYNVKSQLRITVKKGSQEETFPLKSK
jgi:hypothetical protein